MLNEQQFSHTELPNTAKLPYRSLKSVRKTEVREVTHEVRGQKGGNWRSKPGHIKREKMKGHK